MKKLQIHKFEQMTGLKRFIPCTLSVLVFWCLASSTTYHITPGGNDANSGLASSPWKTITKANQVLQAGDTVFIHAGTYDQQIRPVNSGSSHQLRIVYKAFGDGTVKLTSFPPTSGNPSEGAIALGQRDYITVSGRGPADPDTAKRIHLVPLKDAASLGNMCGSEGCMVENIYAWCKDKDHNCSRGFGLCVNFWKSGGAPYESKYNVLRNSTIIGNSSTSNDPNDYTEDLITIAHNAHHNLIDNNHFSMCRHSTLYYDSPKAHSNVIRDNTIANPQHSALSIWSAGVDLADGVRTLVENNTLSASKDTDNPHRGPGNSLQWGSDELIVRHNVITKGGNKANPYASIGGIAGATSTTHGQPYFATDGRVYNNTIVKNGGAAIGMFDFNNGSVDLGRHVFVNNFIYGSQSPKTGAHLLEYWDDTRNLNDRYICNVWGNPKGTATQKILATAKRGETDLAGAIGNWNGPADPNLKAWKTFSNTYDAAPGFANYASEDYSLPKKNKYVDGGAPLTVVASGDAGTGTTLKVDDSRFFNGEASGFPAWMGVSNDWIAVGASVAKAESVQVAGVDDKTNTITLSKAITRKSGDFVWLYKDSKGRQVLYGNAPDIGAFELVTETIIDTTDTTGTVDTSDTTGGQPGLQERGLRAGRSESFRGSPSGRAVVFDFATQPKREYVLKVFDLSGRAVWQHAGLSSAAGNTRLVWRNDQGGGVYMVRLRVGGRMISRKMVVF